MISTLKSANGYASLVGDQGTVLTSPVSNSGRPVPEDKDSFLLMQQRTTISSEFLGTTFSARMVIQFGAFEKIMIAQLLIVLLFFIVTSALFVIILFFNKKVLGQVQRFSENLARINEESLPADYKESKIIELEQANTQFKDLVVGGSLVSADPSEVSRQDSTIIDFAKDQQIQTKIESLITGNERKIMADVLSRLDPEDRENVIYVDESGEIYSNKVSLKASTDSYTFIGNNQYRSATSGLTLTGPGNYPEPIDTTADDNPLEDQSSILSVPPQEIGGSGPYRRVFSNDGYSWMSTYVTLPGGTNMKDNDSAGFFDTGYVYLGGWSSNSTGIDAGMQHSTTFDNWAPVTLANNEMVPSGERFKANQDIYMKFYITSPNEATLAVSGIGIDGVSKTVTIVRHGVSGWNKDGVGSRLKRMTTIGQKYGESMNTGSYMKGVHWHDITIGRYDSNSSSANLIYSNWGSSQTGGYHSWDNRQAKHVFVNYINPGEETVNIQL